MPINSRAKGARFERAILTRLAELTGTRGRRTSDGYAQGNRGDIIHPALEQYNCELKHREQIAMNDWIQQSEDDAGDEKIPIVIWRTNKRGPFVNLPFEHFVELLMATGKSA